MIFLLLAIEKKSKVNGQTDGRPDRQAGRSERKRNTQTVRELDRQTARQIDSPTTTQVYRHTERWMDKQ